MDLDEIIDTWKKKAYFTLIVLYSQTFYQPLMKFVNNLREGRKCFGRGWLRPPPLYEPLHSLPPKPPPIANNHTDSHPSLQNTHILYTSSKQHMYAILLAFSEPSQLCPWLVKVWTRRWWRNLGQRKQAVVINMEKWLPWRPTINPASSSFPTKWSWSQMNSSCSLTTLKSAFLNAFMVVCGEKMAENFFQEWLTFLHV